jgi:hypothetical protein
VVTLNADDYVDIAPDVKSARAFQNDQCLQRGGGGCALRHHWRTNWTDHVDAFDVLTYTICFAT